MKTSELEREGGMEGGRKKKGKKREEKEVQRTFHPSGQDFSRLLRLIALC